MKNYSLTFVALGTPLLASTMGSEQDTTMLIALFALAFVSIVFLFFSSRQLSKVKSEHEKMMKHQQEVENRQSDLLMEMSKNIQNITKETLGDTTKLKTTNESVQKHISKVISSENTIIDATSDLIEFLQIKSKKIHPLTENFKLENLLNDILGQIKSNHSNIDLELIFDVDDNIPDMLNSDTLGISKILVNLIEFCIVNSSKQIALQVSKRSKFNAPTTLHFVIYSDTTVEVNKNIFKTKYNEKTKKYDGMALFVSNELAELMGGSIIARNNYKDSNVEFVLNLPYYEVNSNTLKEHRLDTRLTENQKIYLVDSSPETTLAIKRTLEAIKCHVDTQSKEDFLSKSPDFSKYSTVVIDDRLINSSFIKKISKIAEAKRPNILTLSNVFSKPSAHRIEGTSLHKPLTKESIFYALVEFEQKDSDAQNIVTSGKKLAVHRDRFEDAPNIRLESFAHFADANLLIVEDNLINQKVLTSVLKKSNMNITIANDGQEAVEILSKDNNFDMVLMDINMPIMDGYEATRRIRKNPSLDMVPIVALSALTAADEINKVFIVGMNGYLSKPLEKEKLYTAFDKFINKKNFVEDSNHSQVQEDEIKNLDGLNIESGLKQASGNPIFYIEVLKEFVDAYGDSDKVFEKLIYEHRFEQARMLCLDMRGLAGAVGADEMQELSSEILQKIIFKKYDMLDNYSKTYKEKLSVLNNSIEKYIALAS